MLQLLVHAMSHVMEISWWDPTKSFGSSLSPKSLPRAMTDLENTTCATEAPFSILMRHDTVHVARSITPPSRRVTLVAYATTIAAA